MYKRKYGTIGYTAWPKKNWPRFSVCFNFIKYRPIFKLISLSVWIRRTL